MSAVEHNARQLNWWNANYWFNNRICPICGHHQWVISGVIFEMREHQGPGLVIGGKSNILEVVPVTCLNCGYIFFINNRIRMQLRIMNNPQTISVDFNSKEVKESVAPNKSGDTVNQSM